MTATKEGYLEESIALSAAELLESESYCIEMKKPKGVLLRGKVMIAKYESLLPGATVNLFNHCTQKTETFTSDEFGAFELRLACDCQYDLSAQKTDFIKDKQVFTLTNMDCEDGNMVEKVLKLKLPEPDEPTLIIDKPLTVGAIIRLDDLYYDYNKDYIRADAAIELDKVVSLMKKYPSLEIEMRSHTDSRGTATYNENLSNRRAKSAVQYLMPRGINISRLTANGYGENILTNECVDGVNCNDEKHQENRRTEIKVTNFDEEDLKLDN
jgi:outer membrane protein OmpA-like peptidoglycan-associated protein